jgi:hypothetical protein
MIIVPAGKLGIRDRYLVSYNVVCFRNALIATACNPKH